MDQAATLRQLMKQRGTGLRGGASMNAIEKGRTVLVRGLGESRDRSALILRLGLCLARSREKVLLVDAGEALGELLGASAPGAPIELLSGLWFARHKLEARSEISAEILSDSCGARLALVDAGCYPLPIGETVLVYNPVTDAPRDVYRLVSGLRVTGLCRAQVIVNQVTDGREGQRAFQNLKEVAERFGDVELQYMGHGESDENVRGAVMKRKFLLDLKESVARDPSVELLAKRLRVWVGSVRMTAEVKA